MSTENVVKRSEFEEKLTELLEKRKESNRARWTRQRLQNAKDVLLKGETAKSNGEKVPTAYYYLSQKYELLKIGSEVHVIKRRNEKNQSFIYMVALEDYYEKLLEAHVLTSHGGRDKIMSYLKDKCEVLKEACVLFVSCCRTCNRKRIAPNRIVNKPIITCGFNMRGQVDLIDFQLSHDGEYKWLLNYQDLGTKFLQLRPLTTNHASNVAEELSKIFFTWGAPRILQSDNGSKFLAAVLHELISLWPQFQTVHGCLGHQTQSEASVEKSSEDVENMLRGWMIAKNSKNWSRGCYEVQWQKNTAKHKGTDKTPYEGVFGPTKTALRSTFLPDEYLSGVVKEEVLEATNKQHICSVDTKSNAEPKELNRQCLNLADPMHFVSPENAESNAHQQNAQIVQQCSASADAQQQNAQSDALHSVFRSTCEVQENIMQASEHSPEEEVYSTHVIIKCEPTEYNTVVQMEHFVEAQSRELFKRKHLPVECEMCGKVFVTVSELNIHMRSHTGAKTFECDICHEKFTNDHVAKTHIMKHMGKDQRFKCPVCPKNFKRYSCLRSHVQTHSKNDLFKCKICKDSFKSKNLLQSHMIIHQNKKCFSCDICNKGFLMLWQVNQHKKIHLEEKPYECKSCKKGFLAASKLSEHMRKHSGEKPFECDICKKRFASNQTLKLHKNKHAGEKPFECDICKKRFTVKQTLKLHRIIHLEKRIRVIKCDICKRGFASKNSLWSHMNAFHSDKPAYECDMCGNTYLRRAGLVCHIRRHTGEKPLECDICKQKFRCQTTLKSHKKTHISEADECSEDAMDFKQAVFDTVHIKVENGYSDHTSSDEEDGMLSILKMKFKTEVLDKEACDPLHFNQEVKTKDIKIEMEDTIN